MGPSTPEAIRETLLQLRGWAADRSLPLSWLTLYLSAAQHIAELEEPELSELRQLGEDVKAECRAADVARW